MHHFRKSVPGRIHDLPTDIFVRVLMGSRPFHKNIQLSVALPVVINHGRLFGNRRVLA
jgi:hypothetical protein